PDQAARTVEETARAALELLPRLRERDALWASVRRAYLMLATDAATRGAAGRARRFAREIAARDPTFEPPAKDIAPKVRALYAAERAALLAERAPLEIGGPSGMQVFVDLI